MTDADLHDQTMTLFQRALDQPACERESWLDGQTSDPSIRETVHAMLVQHRLSGPLDAPVFGREPEADAVGSTDPLIGRDIGPWRVTGVLGHGGMGTVYSARRADSTFDQLAAVKVVRPGLSDEFRARFVRERSVLAGLEHPGIARLLGGGRAANGAQYLAMELVNGQPITEYADAHDLGVVERLRLFVKACEAVAYAHRNLVVHRDIKPDHIVVVNGDAAAEPHVKLLDFGVAKLVDGSEDEVMTRTGGGLLTPAYAAPEQVRRGAVTTATDVYALGVVLYELLAGQRPYALSQKTALEAERLICETDPPPPSSATDIEARRRALRGDLDAVVLKALAKEPERRYASADALAEDIGRHLAGIPILARPATARYRAGRFLRRNALGVGAAVLVLMAVGVGSGAALIQAREARLSEQRALEEAERAAAVSAFLERILRAPNDRWYVEAEAKGPDTPIRAVLDEAAARIDVDFADRPDLRADLHHIVGDTFASLGLRDEAQTHLRKVLALRESLHTAPHPKIAEALYYVAAVDRDLARGLRFRVRAADMLRENPGGNNLPFILSDLNGNYMAAGRPDLAEAVSREAFAFTVENFLPGTDGYRYRNVMLKRLAYFIADARLEQNDVPDAEYWLRATGESDAGAAGLNLCTRGRWRLARGDRDAAERLFLRCAEPNSPGEISPSTGRVETAHFELMQLYDSEGRPEAAARYRAGAAHISAVRDSAAVALASLDRKR